MDDLLFGKLCLSEELGRLGLKRLGLLQVFPALEKPLRRSLGRLRHLGRRMRSEEEEEEE